VLCFEFSLIIVGISLDLQTDILMVGER